jgi:simple sugar transport system permease protein
MQHLIKENKLTYLIKIKKILTRAIKKNEFYLFLIIVSYAFIINIFNRSFLTGDNLFSIAKSSAGMGILAIGFFIVLLSGGIDISFASIAITSIYLTTMIFLKKGLNNIFLAFFLSCLIGACLGAVNGTIITLFKIPTLIVTLGTAAIFHGSLLTFVGTRAVDAANVPTCFINFENINLFEITRLDGTKYGFSIFILVLIIIAFITWLILKFTLMGRGIYAIGGNIESARISGFNIKLIQLFIYCYAGALDGIMGVLFFSLIKYLNPLYIVGTELSVIAAVVLGGASIMGGSGSVFGTILGVVLIKFIEASRISLGLNATWDSLIIGALITISVSITSYQNRKMSKKKFSL